jgi:hypothetical protein
MSKIPTDIQILQEQNRQTAIKNLKDAYGLIEKLVQKTYIDNDMDANSSLRNIRTDVSRIISEMGTKGLGNFDGKEGNLEDFYDSEDRFIATSTAFLEAVNNSLLSQDTVDIFLLETQLGQFEKSLNERILIDQNVLAEFKEKEMEAGLSNDNIGSDATSMENEAPGTGSFMGVSSDKSTPSEKSSSPFGMKSSEKPDISNQKQRMESEIISFSDEPDTETLSGIYNYFNLLEHKYSHNHPEVSHDGNYIGDKKWSFDVSDRRITGLVKDSVFRELLHFETYWHPMDDVREMMQFVQSRANAVPGGQFRSLCLVASVWNDEIKDWAKGFMHPRLFIFLYELDTGDLIFNESVDTGRNLYIWHSSGREIVSLEDGLQEFMENNEYFDARDISEETGLNVGGAEKFLQKLADRKKIISIGFGTSSYTKSGL